MAWKFPFNQYLTFQIMQKQPSLIHLNSWNEFKQVFYFLGYIFYLEQTKIQWSKVSQRLNINLKFEIQKKEKKKNFWPTTIYIFIFDLFTKFVGIQGLFFFSSIVKRVTICEFIVYWLL